MEPEKFSQGVRASFARFPNFIQNFITFISGQPIAGEIPLFRVTPTFALIIDILKLVLGVLLSIYIVNEKNWFFLIISYTLTVNGARSLASDAHYGAHGCLTGNVKLDFLIGDVISSLIMSQNMLAYAKGHVINHHGNLGIACPLDPDMELLHKLGFKTGQKISWYWLKMFLTLISFRYYFYYTWVRLQSNLLKCTWGHRLTTILFHGSILSIVFLYGLWFQWSLTFVIPLYFLVPVSAFLQFMSEHLWLGTRKSQESKKEFIRRLSYGRFCLCKAPSVEVCFRKRVCQWIGWSIKMLPQIFCRFFILVSILPSHDYHHRNIKRMDWPMEPYLRQKEIDSGASDYINYYNIFNVYRDLFFNLSMLDPDYIINYKKGD